MLRGRTDDDIAAVLVEPVQSRRLDLQPKEFLHELRRVTEETGSALIFDEVVTGFRVHQGGAQAYFGVRADLATYGKVIGGGVSIGVVAGSPKFMDALDGGQWQYGDASFPEVGVTFFAGTFVRHPLALAAAKAVLVHIREAGPDLQPRLAERAARVANEMRAAIDEYDAPFQLSQFSSLIQLTAASDQKFATLLYYLLRERGIHIYDNRAIVITTAHTDDDLALLVNAFRESLAAMQLAGFIGRTPGHGLTGGRKIRTYRACICAKHIQAKHPRKTWAQPTPFPLTEASVLCKSGWPRKWAAAPRLHTTNPSSWNFAAILTRQYFRPLRKGLSRATQCCWPPSAAMA